MGRETVYFKVCASLDRHNGEQQRIDDREWYNLMESIRELIMNDPEFKRICWDAYETAF